MSATALNASPRTTRAVPDPARGSRAEAPPDLETNPSVELEARASMTIVRMRGDVPPNTEEPTTATERKTAGPDRQNWVLLDLRSRGGRGARLRSAFRQGVIR